MKESVSDSSKGIPKAVMRNPDKRFYQFGPFSLGADRHRLLRHTENLLRRLNSPVMLERRLFEPSR